MDKEKIKQAIEMYEHNTSGIRNLNGSFSKATIIKVEEKPDHIFVRANVTIGHVFDPDKPYKETFKNCEYKFDKETYKLILTALKEVIN